MTSGDAMPKATPPAMAMRRRSRALLGALLVLIAAAAACGSSEDSQARRGDRIAPTVSPTVEATGSAGVEAAADPAGDGESPVTSSVPTALSAPAPTTNPTPHPLAVADTELPPAPIGFDAIPVVEDDGPRPVSLAIDDIGVDGADVIAVGVNPDLSFEVPPAEQVGWYKFGPRPGAAGSAVLAAHIAFDGVDGVFRYLVDVEPGATVEVGFDDGTTQRYRITEVTEYLKQELPASLWADEGEPQLTLITCGGTFNPELSSYESNVVAIAVPI